jgi:hypothetical protein
MKLKTEMALNLRDGEDNIADSICKLRESISGELARAEKLEAINVTSVED